MHNLTVGVAISVSWPHLPHFTVLILFSLAVAPDGTSVLAVAADVVCTSVFLGERVQSGSSKSTLAVAGLKRGFPQFNN